MGVAPHALAQVHQGGLPPLPLQQPHVHDDLPMLGHHVLSDASRHDRRHRRIPHLGRRAMATRRPNARKQPAQRPVCGQTSFKLARHRLNLSGVHAAPDRLPSILGTLPRSEDALWK